MTQCADCLKIIAAMGNKTPIGWFPSAWVKTENTHHFHVLPEADNDPGHYGPSEIFGTRICQVKNPVPRGGVR